MGRSFWQAKLYISPRGLLCVRLLFWILALLFTPLSAPDAKRAAPIVDKNGLVRVLSDGTRLPDWRDITQRNARGAMAFFSSFLVSNEPGGVARFIEHFADNHQDKLVDHWNDEDAGWARRVSAGQQEATKINAFLASMLTPIYLQAPGQYARGKDDPNRTLYENLAIKEALVELRGLVGKIKDRQGGVWPGTPPTKISLSPQDLRMLNLLEAGIGGWHEKIADTSNPEVKTYRNYIKEDAVDIINHHKKSANPMAKHDASDILAWYAQDFRDEFGKGPGKLDPNKYPAVRVMFTTGRSSLAEAVNTGLTFAGVESARSGDGVRITYINEDFFRIFFQPFVTMWGTFLNWLGLGSSEDRRKYVAPVLRTEPISRATSPSAGASYRGLSVAPRRPGITGSQDEQVDRRSVASSDDKLGDSEVMVSPASDQGPGDGLEAGKDSEGAARKGEKAPVSSDEVVGARKPAAGGTDIDLDQIQKIAKFAYCQALGGKTEITLAAGSLEALGLSGNGPHPIDLIAKRLEEKVGKQALLEQPIIYQAIKGLQSLQALEDARKLLEGVTSITKVDDAFIKKLTELHALANGHENLPLALLSERFKAYFDNRVVGDARAKVATALLQEFHRAAAKAAERFAALSILKKKGIPDKDLVDSDGESAKFTPVVEYTQDLIAGEVYPSVSAEVKFDALRGKVASIDNDNLAGLFPKTMEEQLLDDFAKATQLGDRKAPDLANLQLEKVKEKLQAHWHEREAFKIATFLFISRKIGYTPSQEVQNAFTVDIRSVASSRLLAADPLFLMIEQHFGENPHLLTQGLDRIGRKLLQSDVAAILSPRQSWTDKRRKAADFDGRMDNLVGSTDVFEGSLTALANQDDRHLATSPRALVNWDSWQKLGVEAPIADAVRKETDNTLLELQKEVRLKLGLSTVGKLDAQVDEYLNSLVTALGGGVDLANYRETKSRAAIVAEFAARIASDADGARAAFVKSLDGRVGSPELMGVVDVNVDSFSHDYRAYLEGRENYLKGLKAELEPGQEEGLQGIEQESSLADDITKDLQRVEANLQSFEEKEKLTEAMLKDDGFLSECKSKGWLPNATRIKIGEGEFRWVNTQRMGDWLLDSKQAEHFKKVLSDSYKPELPSKLACLQAALEEQLVSKGEVVGDQVFAWQALADFRAVLEDKTLQASGEKALRVEEIAMQARFEARKRAIAEMVAEFALSDKTTKRSPRDANSTVFNVLSNEVLKQLDGIDLKRFDAEFGELPERYRESLVLPPAGFQAYRAGLIDQLLETGLAPILNQRAPDVFAAVRQGNVDVMLLPQESKNADSSDTASAAGSEAGDDGGHGRARSPRSQGADGAERARSDEMSGTRRSSLPAQAIPPPAVIPVVPTVLQDRPRPASPTARRWPGRTSSPGRPGR